WCTAGALGGRRRRGRRARGGEAGAGGAPPPTTAKSAPATATKGGAAAAPGPPITGARGGRRSTGGQRYEPISAIIRAPGDRTDAGVVAHGRRRGRADEDQIRLEPFQSAGRRPDWTTVGRRGRSPAADPARQ